MLKIPKGLKKKKKGKKGKHKGDEDLFTPEELEEYRRQKALKEQQEHQEAEASEEGAAAAVAGAADAEYEGHAAAGAAAGGAPGPAPAKEDEDRFQALLGGVDSILNKTQRDLDRIKSTSFFQRKPTPSELESRRAEGPPARPSAPKAASLAAAAAATTSRKSKKKWVGFEGEEESESDEEAGAQQVAAEPAPEQHAEPPAVHEESEEEETEDEEDGDDIFDTSYIDVITSGEVKLAYIPDSPVEEAADGDDPFDTTYAAKVIGNDEDIKKRQKLEKVSLGIAVDVLTGKAAPPAKPPPLPENAVAKRAVPRRVKPVDLLKLGSFDEGSAPPSQPEEEVEVKADGPKSLLDDEELLAIPEDLPPVGTPIIPPVAPVPVAPAAPEETKEEQKEDKQFDLSEFDVIADKPVVQIPVSNLALVAAALGGPPPPEEEEDPELEDEFAALAQESLQKKKEDEDEFAVDGDDPFDTSAAAVLLGEPDEPAKPAKPAADVDVLLAGPPASWSAFDEDEEHPHPQLKPSRPPPPRPAPPHHAAALHEDVDPFDTSFAHNILPGRTELKLIEKEILGNKPSSEHNEARILSNSDSDFDFNPREGEQTISSVTFHVIDPAGDEDFSPVVHRDLLGGSTSDLSQLGHDPLAPAEPIEVDPDDAQLHEDPFDTSAVEVVTAPGKTELRYLEKEILGDATATPPVTADDDDFDPRAEEARSKAARPDVLDVQPSKSVAFALPSPSVRPDLLASGAEEGAVKFSKPLTPYYADQLPPVEGQDVDPFDTTHVSNLAPGKVELRLLENELVDEAPPRIRASLSDDDFDPRALQQVQQVQQAQHPQENQDLFKVEDGEEVGHRPLTPAVEEAADVDPFDTSIASNIAPGKTELKILENELITNDPQPSIKRTYTDPDFNPRDGPAEAAKDLLNEPADPGHSAKPLTPVLGEQLSLEKQLEEDIDPFDTSIATDIGPGKTELRILESELIGRQ